MPWNADWIPQAQDENSKTVSSDALRKSEPVVFTRHLRFLLLIGTIMRMAYWNARQSSTKQTAITVVLQGENQLIHDTVGRVMLCCLPRFSFTNDDRHYQQYYCKPPGACTVISLGKVLLTALFNDCLWPPCGCWLIHIHWNLHFCATTTAVR